MATAVPKRKIAITPIHAKPGRTRSPRWYTTRRRLVRAALAMDGYTIKTMAAQCDVSHTHFNYVLRGVRISAYIDRAVYTILAHTYGERMMTPFRVGFDA